MRLITNEIYRAFPELDRYSDEQCIRFVKAARSSGIWREAYGFLIVCIFIASIAATVAGGRLVLAAVEVIWRTHPNRETVDILSDICMVLGVVVGNLAALFSRDFLLRRRVRYVLRARGVCANCRYGLTGLPINASNMVVCPECATESEVDPSLGELVIEDSGKALYAPGIQNMPKPWLSLRAKRRLRRIGIGLAVLLLGVFPAICGGYEFWIRAQATHAAADRPGAKGFAKYVDSLNTPSAQFGSADAWSVIGRCSQIQIAAESAVLSGHSLSFVDGRQTFADYASVGLPARTLAGEDDRYLRACAQLGREMLGQLGPAGLYAEFTTLAACPNSARTVVYSATAPTFMMALPDAGIGRILTRINTGRMSLAIETQSPQEFADALEANLALSRIFASQVSALEFAIAMEIERISHERIRAMLATKPSARWLDAIEGAFARQAYHLPPTHPWEGEYLAVVDYFAWVFANPNNVRFGKHSPALAMPSPVGAGLQIAHCPGTMGTYEGNKTEFRALINRMEAVTAIPNWQRTPGVVMDLSSSKHVLISTLSGSYDRVIASSDRLALDRAGTVTLIALERSRLRTGRYPAALTELIPLDIKELPLDPWTGKPLGYALVDPAADPHHRSFLLYGLGANRTDDGGKWPANTTDENRVLDDPGAKGDYVINDPGRWP